MVGVVSTSIAFGPGLLHGKLHFALRFRSFKFQTENLVLEIPILFLDTKLDKNCDLWIFSKTAWLNTTFPQYMFRIHCLICFKDTIFVNSTFHSKLTRRDIINKYSFWTGGSNDLIESQKAKLVEKKFSTKADISNMEILMI